MYFWLNKCLSISEEKVEDISEKPKEEKPNQKVEKPKKVEKKDEDKGGK